MAKLATQSEGTVSSQSPPATEQSPESPRDIDPFILKRLYPSPIEILKVTHARSSDIFRDCIYALDASTLLLPFSVSSESLENIRDIYTRLATANQVFLPAHALREFAHNRTEKIRAICDILTSYITKTEFALDLEHRPTLGGTLAYNRLKATIVKLKTDTASSVNECKKQIREMIDTYRNWHLSDPVSQMYSTVFQPESVVDTTMSDADIAAEGDKRKSESRPPGYKDSSKDNKYGDLIIWETLKELGTSKKKNVVFVTEDKKADWFVRVSGQPVFPRSELLYEFLAATGCQFTAITFSQFLEMMGAKFVTKEEAQDASKADSNEKEVVQTERLRQTSNDRAKISYFIGMLAMCERIAKNPIDVCDDSDFLHKLRLTSTDVLDLAPALTPADNLVVAYFVSLVKAIDDHLQRGTVDSRDQLVRVATDAVVAIEDLRFRYGEIWPLFKPRKPSPPANRNSPTGGGGSVGNF